MIIITEAGPRQFYNPKSVTPPAILRAEREWRDAWNKSAVEFNVLRARAQEIYKRMMDTKELPLIPPNETKIPW